MEPALSPGDIVITQPASMGDVEEGDMVLYQEANTGVPFVHRVETIQEYRQNMVDGETGEALGTQSDYRFSTRGDANQQPDSAPVTEENYEGMALLTLPTSVFGENASPQALLTGLAVLLLGCWAVYEGFRFVTTRRKGAETRG